MEEVSDKENEFTVTNELDTTSVKVKKIWNDGNIGSHDKIVINLLVGENTKALDGECNPITAELDGIVEYTFENLPKLDKDGEEITYSINEEEVPGYSTEYSVENDVNVITNTKIDAIMVKKIWNDGSNVYLNRPNDLTIELRIRKGETTTKVDARPEVSATNTNEWLYSWKNLALYDEDGNQIIYEGFEPVVPNGYTVSYSDDKLTITNSTETTKLVVTKVWKDYGYTEYRPANGVTLHLLNDGKEISGYTFTPSKNGDVYTYSDSKNSYKYDK